METNTNNTKAGRNTINDDTGWKSLLERTYVVTQINRQISKEINANAGRTIHDYVLNKIIAI